MTDAEEKLWLEGERAGYVAMLAVCLKALGHDDPAAGAARWVREREAVVASLRIACRAFGDNEWPDEENLADVVAAHLCRHLHANKGKS